FNYSPSTTRTRWRILWTMPRTAGVSLSVRRRFILLRPSPISVCSCTLGRRMGLRYCSTVMVLPALASAFGPGVSAAMGSPPAISRRFARGLRIRRAVAAAGHDLAHLLAAPGRDAARILLPLEGIEGSAHHIIGIGGAQRLGNHVLHTQHVEHGARRAARNDARAGRG